MSSNNEATNINYPEKVSLQNYINNIRKKHKDKPIEGFEVSVEHANEQFQNAVLIGPTQENPNVRSFLVENEYVQVYWHDSWKTVETVHVSQINPCIIDESPPVDDQAEVSTRRSRRVSTNPIKSEVQSDGIDSSFEINMLIEPENSYEFNKPIIRALLQVLLETPEARERFHTAVINTTDSNGKTWGENAGRGTYLHMWIIERVMVGTKREPEPFSNMLKKWQCPKCTHYNYKDLAMALSFSSPCFSKPMCADPNCGKQTVRWKWIKHSEVVQPIDL